MNRAHVGLTPHNKPNNVVLMCIIYTQIRSKHIPQIYSLMLTHQTLLKWDINVYTQIYWTSCSDYTVVPTLSLAVKTY